ncbi:MAG TPA: phosphate ABC transporter, permease protein PstA, partial [Gammaproteobacteria bacterium]|nr:phosphate ABC transporter, permease protein PstA [Gammaproteobacteria bacterium]
MSKKLRKWLRAGSPWVWFNAGAVAISIIMVAGLIGLLAFRGLRHFWPTDVMQARYQPPGLPATEVIGELIESETVLAERLQDSGVDVDPAKNFYQRDLWKFGNREITG